MTIEFTDLAQVHVIVDDIDEASSFYRDVLGMIEMQSHRDIANPGLAAYYGYQGDPEEFRVSLCFLFIPEVITLKLVEVHASQYKGQIDSKYDSSKKDRLVYGRRGVGPLSVVVKDLDAAYEELVKKARDYSSIHRFELLSPPMFLSPLRPHEIGATKYSVLHGKDEILEEFSKAWPFRAKFQLIDPFGVQWEFNNDVDGMGED